MRNTEFGQPVDECIKKYKKLSKKVFRIDNVIKGVPVGPNECRFNEEPFERAIKSIVKEITGDENAPMADPDDQSTDFCPVFVVATEGEDAGGPVKLFRSYGFYKDQCPIWQAARATSAAPSYFSPAWVSVPSPEGWYIDGGIRRNNPSETALNEARNYWKTAKRFFVVSIGTGVQKSVDFIQVSEPPEDIDSEDSDDSSSETTITSRFTQLSNVISHAHTAVTAASSIVPFANNAVQLARVPGGILTLKRFAEQIARLSTESEDTHRKMLELANSHDDALRFPYYRFNVDRGMEEIGLEEWKKITKMGALTRRYLSDPSVQNVMRQCSKSLLNPDIVERETHKICSMGMLIVIGILPKNFMVPYESNEYFVGRKSLLKQLFDKFRDSTPRPYRRRIALYGLGGIGKTQVALAYAHENKFNYDFVFWISGVNHAALLSGYQEIASKIECAAGLSESRPSEVAKKVLEWFQRKGNWLLVIDNVDDVTILKGLLPSREGNGHTLITTRNPNSHGIPAEGMAIEVLDIDEAISLFMMFSNLNSSIDSEPFDSEVREIVEELGRLPLAIVQSAAYIRETGSTVSEYLSMYRTSREDRKILIETVPDGNWDYQHSVATTWLLSFEIIKEDKKYPHAARLLYLFAFLNPDLILLDFLQAGAVALDKDLQTLLTSRAALDQSLRLLQKLSIIKRVHQGQGIQIHRLVQEAIQLMMTEQDRLDWWETVGKICSEAFPHGQPDEKTWPLCRKYENQLIVPLSKALHNESGINVASACNYAAFYLLYAGKFTEAEILSSKAHKLFVEIYGEYHSETLTAMGNIAAAYSHQGRWNEAVTLQEKIVEDSKTFLGEQHPDTLRAMNNLASTYGDQGQWDKADELFEKALEGYKTLFGENHRHTLAAMGNLASSYSTRGQWNEAIVLFEKVLEGNKRLLGEQHPSTLRAISNLALTYENQGRRNEALVLQEKVLKSWIGLLGEHHPSVLAAMNNLALTYRSQKRWNDAVVLQEKVLEGSKEMLGEQHPNTLMAMNNLASTYSNQGRLDEATVLQEKALEAQIGLLGEQHRSTLMTMGSLAWTYECQGRRDEAIVLKEKVMKGQKVLLGEEHSLTLTAMGNLASAYSNHGRLDDAAALEENILESYQKSLGEEHPDTLNAMRNLASTYSNQGRWGDTAMLEEKLLESHKKSLGEEHPETLTAMGNLALAYSSQERWDEALVLEELVMEGHKRLHGEQHPDTLAAMANLASAYSLRERFDEAVVLQEKVVDGLKKLHGDRDQETLKAMNNLAPFYWGQGKWDEAILLEEKVLDGCKELLGEEHPHTLTTTTNLEFMKTLREMLSPA